MGIHPDFAFAPIPPIPHDPVPAAPSPFLPPGIHLPPLVNFQLGPLALLPGVWSGRGFNQIWRPFHGSQDRFLQLNLTQETLELKAIPGEIPNRGLLQKDISLFGLTYLQQIQDVNVKGPNGKPAGIHVEPGIWIHVPATTDPADPRTVARMANIPHGTSLLAQGTASVVQGPPVLPAASITPFQIGNPANTISFPESDLSIPSAFRSPPADIVGVTQAMVNNPNSFLGAGLTEHTVISTTVLEVSTVIQKVPTSGGGSVNIAFLDGAAGGPNARAARMDSIFWIETFKDATGKLGHQLQYTQRVLLDFNGLSWPHVSVATLIKQH